MTARPGSQHPINCPFHQDWPWESALGGRSGLWGHLGERLMLVMIVTMRGESMRPVIGQ